MTVHWKRSVLAAAAATVLAASAHAAGEDIKLPSPLVWTAYDVGSTGYNQAIGFGSAMKNQINVTLRVLPGKNDASRLIPLRDGKAHYALTGSGDMTFAQEGMYLFGTQNWGPQALSQLITCVSDATPSLGTTRDSGIKTLQDIRGRRVAWVKGAPSLQNSTRALLAYAGLTWDDVVKVELGGYGASFQALIDGQVDVIHAFTNAPGYLKVDASPRGLRLLPVPHNDEAGWARLREITPYNFKAIAKDGPTLPPEGQEMFTAPYPILATIASRSDDEAYNMTKAIVVLFDHYKDATPGATGWAVGRQRFAETLLPFHPGSVRYYKEIGAWTPEAQQALDRNQRRQDLLVATWKAYGAGKPSDEASARQQGWMKARADALTAAGMPVIQSSWDVEG